MSDPHPMRGIELARSLKVMQSFSQLAAVVSDPHTPLSAKAIAGMVVYMAACAKRGDTLLEAKDKMRQAAVDCESAMPMLWDTLRSYT